MAGIILVDDDPVVGNLLVGAPIDAIVATNATPTVVPFGIPRALGWRSVQGLRQM